MRKGFTLIELLAVIVILAIIALIAAPIVINIINDAKTSSIERSVDLYLDAVENAIVKENLNRKFNPNECNIQSNGSLICDGDTENILEINIKGEKPTEGEIILSNSKIVDFKNLKYESEYVSKGENGEYEISQERKLTIITFTINGIQFNAEEGMTWNSFISSNYNTDNYVNSSTFSLSEYSVKDSSNNSVFGDMQIINNEQYIIHFYGKT